MKKKLFFCVLLIANCLSGVYADDVKVQGITRTLAKVPANFATRTTNSSPAVDFDSIQYWVGQGDKEAALVVKFNDESNKSLVWGYRWSGTATGEDMFRAIAQSDSRLILFTQQTNYNGTVCGIGYYPDGNVLSDVTFDLDGAMSDSRVNFRYYSSQTPPSVSMGQTSYPEENAPELASDAIREAKETGILQHPFDHPHYGYSAYDYDHWTSASGYQRWRAAWYDGYWSYWTANDADDDYSYSGVGYSNRTLTTGCVDGWSYVSDMNNWYSANMAGGTLEYVAPQNLPASDAQRRTARARETDPTVYQVGSLQEVRDIIDADDFVEGSTIIFKDEFKGKVIENDTPEYGYQPTKSFVLDGNGIIIDGNNKYGFYIVEQGVTVTFKNIKFVNFSESRPIAVEQANLYVENCIFESCTANVNGAAIDFAQYKSTSPMHAEIKGCMFYNCGGATSSSLKGILRIKAMPDVTDENSVSATIVSCTFFNNSMRKGGCVEISNSPYVKMANNVVENFTSTKNSEVYCVSLSTADTFTSMGYNVVNSINVEGAMEQTGDIVDNEQTDNMILKDGEYVVDVQSNAYKHLPANTVFEGISLPVNDVNGNPVDYTKETNSGATQKDNDVTSKIAEHHGDDDIQDGMELYSLGGMRLYNTGDASGLFKKAMVKNGKTIFIKVQ